MPRSLDGRGPPLSSLLPAQLLSESRKRVADRSQIVKRRVGGDRDQWLLGIANAKLAYERYKALFAGERWESLATHGATTRDRLLDKELLTSTDGRASSASVLSAFWHEYELSRRRRALEQLVRSAHFGEWQALGHDRVDLATTKQLE